MFRMLYIIAEYDKYEKYVFTDFKCKVRTEQIV